MGAVTFKEIPTSALALYTYFERLAQGLRQLMCGNRKVSLAHIRRGDIAELTHEAENISSITYVMDVDKEEAEKILAS